MKKEALMSILYVTYVWYIEPWIPNFLARIPFITHRAILNQPLGTMCATFKGGWKQCFFFGRNVG